MKIQRHVTTRLSRKETRDFLRRINLAIGLTFRINTENYIEYDKKTNSATDKSEEKREIVDLLYKFFNSSKIANLTHKFLKKLNLKLKILIPIYL